MSFLRTRAPNRIIVAFPGRAPLGGPGRWSGLFSMALNELAIIVFWGLLGLAMPQVVMALRFVWALFTWDRKPGDPDFCPKAAVILCLRGADPFLEKCIRAVLRLDYPACDVKIVVDCREDPAWGVVQRVVAESPGAMVEIQPLTRPPTTCSLKCSSLLAGDRQPGRVV